MPTLVATPGAANANSYATLAEANAYFDERLPLPTPWVTAGDGALRALIMAARVLNAMSQPHRVIRYDGDYKYYYTNRQWTGLPTDGVQRMAWPRVGMFDANGNAIDDAVIPQALKEAQSELAGQLIIADTTLDNAAKVKGLKSVKAGSVEVSFKDMIEAHVLPDAVLNLMPPSWLTDELIEPALRAWVDIV
jgi:hypothetical protein